MNPAMSKNWNDRSQNLLKNKGAGKYPAGKKINLEREKEKMQEGERCKCYTRTYEDVQTYILLYSLIQSDILAIDEQ